MSPETGPAPDARPELHSVYRVVSIVSADPQGWEQAAAAGVAELAKSITDLRIARVLEHDVALHDDGTCRYRVKLAVSYRIDRLRLLPTGQVTTVRRYLVIVDEAADDEALQRAVAPQVAAGAAEFHVVMPIRLPSVTGAAAWGDPLVGAAVPSAMGLSDDEALEEARGRLQEAIDDLSRAGSSATGEISFKDPLSATLDVLERGSFDEIVLSTLPHSLSRRLHLDLPHRLARHTHLPITRVEAPPG